MTCNTLLSVTSVLRGDLYNKTYNVNTSCFSICYLLRKSLKSFSIGNGEFLRSLSTEVQLDFRVKTVCKSRLSLEDNA